MSFFKDKQTMSTDGLKIIQNGQGNLIDTQRINRAINSSIDIKGSHNTIIFEEGVFLNGLSIVIEGEHNQLIVGANARLTGRFIMKITPGNSIRIGKGTSMGGVNIICGEGSTVDIGEDCMLAFGIEIRTTDSHAIFDKQTRQRINLAQDIAIGNHVWLGAYVILLGGACVSQGSVVGIRSLVSAPLLEPDTIYGGVPARALRHNIYWERPLLG